jgi:putative molybdopterin biosynthesis protein
MVRQGNPKRIRRIEDLVRDDVVFINRQRGAGTGLLLDFMLRRNGLEAARIQGHEREAYTHMAVASAVASGAADAGLGIYAAAQALGLDFIPIAKERYDLVIPEVYADSIMVREALAILASPEFQHTVRSLGGYDTAETGRIATLEPLRRST